MNNSTDILASIENEFTNVANIRKSMMVAKKVQLHSGIEGFNSPDAYAIYRNTGGNALGVVGGVFEPMNLNLFLDTIIKSVEESSVNIDLSKLTYNEYKEGAKVVFRLPLKQYEIKTKMVGDVIETALEFRTGFDGKTKVSLGHSSYRIFCANGAGNWKNDVELSFKNTLNNQSKLCLFTSEIMTAIHDVDANVAMPNKAVKVPVLKQAEIDTFLTKLTGYDVAQYKDLTTRKRNILDSINASIAIEMANTGHNMFSLLQGVTRYTTHDLAGSEMESILYSNVATINKRAHELVNAVLN